MADPLTKFSPLPRGTGAVVDDTTLRVLHQEPQLSRTNYFDGRLLTASAFNRDIAYFDRRLLAAGLVQGDGVATGLVTTLVGQTVLRVTGGTGIARSGRAIVLDRATSDPLEVDLGDAGLIAARNAGIFTGFHDGLYAVCLMHSTAGTGATDMFPRDLTSARTTAFDTVTDFVEIVLVPVPVAVPRASAFQTRALLARAFAGQSPAWLPDDCLPLGVMATRRGLPAWFDASLLRHPVRTADAVDAVQRDLGAAYRALYADIVASLATPEATFAVADYFSLLPPGGLAPKAAFDPQAGTQSFFPETIDVALTPVRTDEIDVLLDEAMLETPVDLAAGEPAQLVVLAPLSPSDFGVLGRALEPTLTQPAPAPFKPYPTLRLPRIDPLALRLRGRIGPKPVDATAQVWAKIWSAVQGNALPYLVRPVDGAARGTSVATLAAGYTLAQGSASPEDPAILKLRAELKDAEDKAAAAAKAQVDAAAENQATIAALQQQAAAAQTAAFAAGTRADTAEAQQKASDARAASLAATLQKVGERLAKQGVPSGPKIGDPVTADAALADWDTTEAATEAKNKQQIATLMEQVRLAEAKNQANTGILTKVASRLKAQGVATPERLNDVTTADAAIADWDTVETQQTASKTAAQQAAADTTLKLDAVNRENAALRAQNSTLTTQAATLTQQNATLTTQVATARRLINTNRGVLVGQRLDVETLQRAGLMDPT